MNNELPLHLYKANAELQLQITRLLQESGRHWLEAMQQLSTDGARETTLRIQDLQQAADWPGLATLSSVVFWRLCQSRMGDVQAVGQAAAKNQVAFANGLRLALASWQESVAEGFGASGDAASFTQLCQRWTQPWAAQNAAPRGKTRK